jgi:hypothetical protein
MRVDPDDYYCEADYKAERKRRRDCKKESKLQDIEDGLAWEENIEVESEDSDSDNSANYEKGWTPSDSDDET